MKPFLGISVCAAAVLLIAVSVASARTWTDRHGRVIEAQLVNAEGGNVVMEAAGGKVFTMAMADFSAVDQQELARQLSTSMPVRRVEPQPGGGSSVPVAGGGAGSRSLGGSWPREVRMDGASVCKVVLQDAKNRRFVYESPGYRFTSDARITDDALRNFSVMFETTRKYALSLPLGLSGRTREGKYDILLFAEMADYVRSGGPPDSGGCYVPSLGVVMVPMESLGLKKSGDAYTLDTKKTNLVLVHELAHQLTPASYYAHGARGWFSEGLAEYMAATPYHWGYFSPDPHGNVVKTFVTSTGNGGLGGRNLGSRIQAPKLRDLLLMDYAEFSGANGSVNYSLGLLVTHYFFHMEGGGRGTRMRSFLEGLQQGASGEAALKPLLGGGSYEKLEAEISTEWGKKGVQIKFGK